MYQHISLNCNKCTLLCKMLIIGELHDVEGILEHCVLYNFSVNLKHFWKNVYLKIIIKDYLRTSF